MKLEWDPTKAVLNLQKHGVSFEEGAHVFKDENRLEMYDSRDDYGEDRWATIGLSYRAVLYVVYTIRDEETIRLISVRKAYVNEQKKYFHANDSS